MSGRFGRGDPAHRASASWSASSTTSSREPRTRSTSTAASDRSSEQIATHRLTIRHGVALDAGDGHAHRLLGDEAWALLRPDRELPDERRGPRLGVHEIEAIVARLEKL